MTPEDTQPDHFKPSRILVIDDEPGFTRMVKLHLEKAGAFEVRQVNNSTEALSQALDFSPDVILLDVVMPEADGGDVAIALRSNKKVKEIPILFISAMVSQKEAVDGMFYSGGERFLAKPVNMDVLVKCIQELLENND